VPSCFSPSWDFGGVGPREGPGTPIQTSLTVSPPLILIFAMILPLRYEPGWRVVRGQASSGVAWCLSYISQGAATARSAHGQPMLGN